MDLITQVRTANSLINFVTGGQMNVALTLIGDNHFRTAERVLRSLPNAHDQAALLRIGISHLEGAHTAYQKQWKSRKSRLNSLLVTEDFRLFTYELSCKKDIYTCCLLAASYAYLKEEKLALLAIEQAEEAQNDKNELRGYSINPLEVWLFHYTFTVSHVTDLPALIQLRNVPEVSLPDYKNNLLRILPELCSY